MSAVTRGAVDATGNAKVRSMSDSTHQTGSIECLVDAAYYEAFPSLGDEDTREMLRHTVAARSIEIEAILEDEERSDEEVLEDIVDAVRDALLLQAVGKLRVLPDGTIHRTTPVGPEPTDAALARIYDRLDALETDILEAVDEIVGED